MEPRLIQQQSQRLILSPQIRQYLRLLQLPLAELEQAVEVELSENPLLEEKQVEKSDKPEEQPQDPEPEQERTKAEEIKVGENYDRFAEMDENLQNYEYPDFSVRDRRDLEDRKNFQDSLITKPEVLSDFLMWQVRFLDFSEEEKKIAEEIIGNIDEDGYLRASIEELALACKTTTSAVEKVLQQVQELDPPGIAARNLQEALGLQIKKKIREANPSENSHDDGKHLDKKASDEITESAKFALKIVTEQLPLLEKRDWAGLARVLNANIDEIRKAAVIIARLEPRPGRTFYTDESIAVVPDAVVNFSEDEGEKFKIEIHDEVIPEIRINPYYRRLLRSKEMDEKGRAFLREKMQAALNFMKALKLRKSTIREITEEIVKAQPEFFEKGFLHLKPLRLKDIAYNLGIHESTVSRAIHGKYVSTPQGLIPYKSFFSTRLETTDGSAESQKSIMQKIRIVLEKENPAKPLSDQEIVKILQGDGIVIARRTVAKYRELLKILPSNLRRKR